MKKDIFFKGREFALRFCIPTQREPLELIFPVPQRSGSRGDVPSGSCLSSNIASAPGPGNGNLVMLALGAITS